MRTSTQIVLATAATLALTATALVSAHYTNSTPNPAFDTGVRYGSNVKTHTPSPSSPPPAERITEDDPRWDCATMGNRICGKGPVR